MRAKTTYEQCREVQEIKDDQNKKWRADGTYPLITIDRLKEAGFNCDSIRVQFKDNFVLHLNRHGEFHYNYFGKDLEVKTMRELADLYFTVIGEKLFNNQQDPA